MEKSRRVRAGLARMYGGEKYVSINGRGDIVLNKEAYESLRGTASVALCWDAKRRLIGIKRPVYEDERFYMVRSHGRGGKFKIIRGRMFMKKFGIEIGRTLRFKKVEVEKGPMLVVALPKEVGEKGSGGEGEKRGRGVGE